MLRKKELILRRTESHVVVKGQLLAQSVTKMSVTLPQPFLI